MIVLVPAGGDLSGALYRAMPGDVIVAGTGEHRTGVWINQRSGTAAAPITLRGEPGAVIRPPASAWNAISVNVHFVVIEDLTIIGARGDGIEANGVHHFTVRRCKISDCGESGVQTNYCDHVLIEDNECDRNASSGWYSGISLFQNREAGGPHSGEFRNVVRRNLCRDNFTRAGYHTDGNGIIIDDFQSTQTAGFANYPHPTLVEGNLCTGNGGKGVQVTWSDNVTVRRNTCVGNNTDPLNDGTWRGDISISQSKGARVEANIAFCIRGAARLAANRAYDNTGTTTGFNTTAWVGNIGWDEAGAPSVRNDGQAAPTGILWANPRFTNYVPSLAGAANAGWRPGAIPPVTPPTEPTIMELAAALEALRAAIETRLGALEARPTDPEIAARVAALEAEVADQKAFDQRVKDL